MIIGLDVIPKLDGVAFDLSKCGSIELWYDGAMKDKEVIVTTPSPVSYFVDVLSEEDVVLGDAREIINDALSDWMPVIQELGILKADDPETRALRTILLEE